METYPKRPSHFAHKFCRIMMRCCVAQDIGPDAAYMLTQIVHTEDAAHYRRAVRFFNDQLVAACGFANVKSLQRSRERAVESGWLHYEEGARSRPAIYWVTVPTWAADVDSGPMDEGRDTQRYAIEDKYIVENDQATVLSPSTIRPQSVHNVSTVCPTIYPSPIPTDKELASRHVASWVRPANCREQRHTDALVLWQMARKDKHGSFLSEPSWMAECAKWSHWTADQWSAQLLQSAAHGTLNLATYATNGNGTAKQAKPESHGLGPMKPIRESRNRTPAT